MQYSGLTAAKFADEIGVQRSGISHILSGRNNPSFDLIIRILKRYPDISTDWLIQGTGSMLKDQGETSGQTNVQDTLPFEMTAAPEITVKQDTQKETKLPEPQDNVKKTVTKVCIFYSDNTFEQYTPA